MGSIPLSTEQTDVYRSLLDELPDLVFRYRISPPGFDYVSNASENLTGYAPADFYADPELAVRIIHPEDRDRIRMGNHAGRLSELPPFRLINRTGRSIWVELHATLVRDGEGRVVALRGIARDVTSRRQAEADLHQSQALLQSIIDNTAAAIYVKDREGRLTVANRQLAQVYGCTVPDILGKTSYEIVGDPNAAEAHSSNDRKVLETGEPIAVEESVPGDEGDRVFLSLKFPIRDARGDIYAIGGISTEITDRKRMERQLRESEQRASDLVRYAPTAIYEIDFRGPKFITVNDAMCRMSGYSREELLAASPFDLLEEESRLRFLARIKDSLQGAPIDQHVEYEVRTKDGRHVSAVLNTTLLREKGKPIGAFVIAHDITERKRIERELKESEERYSVIFDQSPFALALIRESDGIVVSANDAFLRLFEYDRQQIVGQSGENLRVAEREEQMEAFGKLYENGFVRDLEVSRRTRSGIVRHVSLNLDWVSIGGARHILATLRDVTDRRQAQEALRESEARTSEILESISDGVWAVDENWNFTYLNQRAALNLGYRPEDLVGKSLWEMFPGIRGTAHEECYRGVMEDRRACQIEIDGVLTGRSYSISVYPSGKGISVYWQDISARKRAERERAALLESERQALARAEAAVRARDQFISLASHELKTPLTTIKGYAELVLLRGEQTGIEPNVLKMLETIHAQSRRMEKMISGLLDISRIEQGQLALEHDRVDLDALLRSVIDDVRLTLRKHTIEYLNEDGPTFVGGDESRLEQVLQNLIQNAIKYSPVGGPVRVELRRERQKARFMVSDHGIGIPADDLPRLFTRFHRARNAESKHIGGLGVGLFVVREIVRLHGGEISVVSEEGKGSTFTVELPLAENPLAD